MVKKFLVLSMLVNSSYIPCLYFQRTSEEKNDQILSWNRDDFCFFASGACHILAYAFLQLHADSSFYIVHIKPENGYSGNHMYATNGTWAFDFAGWTLELELLSETVKAYIEIYPGWSYRRIVVTDTLEDYCAQNYHRLPSQFAYNPWPRAVEYIKRFEPEPPSNN